MQTSGWTPAYRSTSATLTAHGSAAPMRTPMGCCASTFPKAPISACTAPRRLQPWRPPSTPAPERRLLGKHPQKRLTSCFNQTTKTVLRRPLESALAAAVAMVHQSRPLKRTPVIECLFESIENEAGFGRSRRPPADDPPGKDVDDEGDVDEALPGRDIGEIRQPQRIRPRRLELPVYLVTRTGRRFVADRRLHRLAADRAVKTHLLHQPRRRAAGDRDPLAAQLSPDLA